MTATPLVHSSAQSPGSARIQRTGFAYFLLLLTVLLWASAFAGIRFVLAEISPLELTVARLVIAAILLVAIGAIIRVPLPAARDIATISFAAILGFSLYHFALNLGTATITAGQASFIVATIPIWTAVLAARFLHERLYWWTWVGILLGIGGVAYMSLQADDARLSVGSLFVLAATFCAAGNMTLMKQLLQRYSALHLSIYTTIIGAIPFLLFLPLSWPSFRAMSIQGWWVTIYLALGPIVLGYWLSSIALSRLPASRTAQMLLLIPPTSAVIAWLTIHETPGDGLFIGGSMILVGVLIGNIRLKKRPQQLEI